MLSVAGKTTLASLVANRLNTIHRKKAPGCASIRIATAVSLDGYHFSRAQLSAMPDPASRIPPILLFPD